MKTKICSNMDCPHDGKPQPIERFMWRNKAAGKLHGKCSPCYYQAQKRYRADKKNTPASQPNTAHMRIELNQKWDIKKFYRVLKQYPMGAEA